MSAIWSGGIAKPAGIHFSLNIAQNLLGLKGVDTGIWRLDYPADTPIPITRKTDSVALYLHFIALLFFLGLTYLYYKRSKAQLPAEA